MEFKSKIDLALFISQLEKEGWLESEWVTKQIVKDGKDITRAQRLYKINFSRVKKND